MPDEILEQLPRLLQLTEAETEVMYDLAAKSRNTVSADLPKYIMEKDIVRAALRTVKKHNATDKQREDFISGKSKKASDSEKNKKIVIRRGVKPQASSPIQARKERISPQRTLTTESYSAFFTFLLLSGEPASCMSSERTNAVRDSDGAAHPRHRR